MGLRGDTWWFHTAYIGIQQTLWHGVMLPPCITSTWLSLKYSSMVFANSSSCPVALNNYCRVMNYLTAIMLASPNLRELSFLDKYTIYLPESSWAYVTTVSRDDLRPFHTEKNNRIQCASNAHWIHIGHVHTEKCWIRFRAKRTECPLSQSTSRGRLEANLQPYSLLIHNITWCWGQFAHVHANSCSLFSNCLRASTTTTIVRHCTVALKP